MPPDKRKKVTGHRFQPGNKAWQNRRAREADPNPASSYCCLRSRRGLPGDTEDTQGTMRLIHLRRNCDMWNYAIREHQHTDGTCRNPEFWPCEEQKKGLVVAQRLKCVRCAFITPVFKLYDEVDQPTKRGPKPAVQNVALQNAIVDASSSSSS